MNLLDHYNRLYTESINKIEVGEYQIDEFLNSPNDKRFGVTLLFQPSQEVKNEIQKFLAEMKMIEPHQYYYRNSDIHVTVTTIISSYDGFNLSQISVEEYVKVIQESIAGFNSFEIELKGLTASPSCIMVQGFFTDDILNQIRNKLKHNFQNSGLEQSIDKRYILQTAHSTIIRLKDKLIDRKAFIKKVEDYKDYNFGTFTVYTLEFVYNDWYQRKEHVKLLETFNLGNNEKL